MTRGISEAVFLGSRVVVFIAGPARMVDDFEIDLPFPRTLDLQTDPKFGDYMRRIYRLLRNGMTGNALGDSRRRAARP